MQMCSEVKKKEHKKNKGELRQPNHFLKALCNNLMKENFFISKRNVGQIGKMY